MDARSVINLVFTVPGMVISSCFWIAVAVKVIGECYERCTREVLKSNQFEDYGKLLRFDSEPGLKTDSEPDSEADSKAD